MSDCDFRHLHTTRGCFIPSIPLSYKMEAQQLRYCPFQFLSCRGKGYTQALAIVQAIQLSYPHIRIFILTAGQLVRNFNRFPAVCLVYRQQHATLPVLFPKSDKLQNDRLWISPHQCFYLLLAKGSISIRPHRQLFSGLRAHHLFLNVRITCCQCLDLCIGKSHLVDILTASDRRFTGHDLPDEFLLILDELP